MNNSKHLINIIDFRCDLSICIDRALWECNCNKYFCEKHILLHSSKARCQIIHIEVKYKEIIEKCTEDKNALKGVQASIIKVAKNMILEVNRRLIENLMLIKEEKAQIKKFAQNLNISSIQNTINWTRDLSIINQNSTFFSLNVIRLLSVKENIHNEFDEFELLKSEAKKDKDIIEQISYELGTLKKEFKDKNKQISGFKQENSILIKKSKESSLQTSLASEN